jgi:hypothetical protein
MNRTMAATASILKQTGSDTEGKKSVSKTNTRQQQHPPCLEDKYILPVSLRLLPYSSCNSKSSSMFATDLDVLSKDHTSLDQLLEHLDRYDLISSKDQEREDATATVSTSLSSSTMISTATTSTASSTKSSLKRNVRIVNDNSNNEIVSSTQSVDDNNQYSNSTKRMKYTRRNSAVIRDIKQLSQIATDLSTISKN